MNKQCEICSSSKSVSVSKADGGLLMCKQCKKDFGSKVTNSRPGATRK